jgi:hypothetical protein
MRTERSTEFDLFGAVEGTAAGGRFRRWRDLLGRGRPADRAVGLIDRFAASFEDRRVLELVEHSVRTLVGQGCSGSHSAIASTTMTSFVTTR